MSIQKIMIDLKNEGYENICFWLPSYNIGGGTFCIAELIKQIIPYMDSIKIYIMDYHGGYLSFLLRHESRVNVLKFDEKNPYFLLKEKSIIVTNTTRIIQLKQMHPENKIFLWHYETLYCAWNVVFLQNETSRIMKLLYDNNAVNFIDWAARDSLNGHGVKFDKKFYWPIILKEKVILDQDKKIIDKESINLCWLSRLVPDKIQSLFAIIKAYAKYNTDKKKVLHIIGDGRSRVVVENFCKDYENVIEFIFTGTIERGDLDRYLIKNVDIVFGMGTSILEAAALALPSVVVLLDFKDINDDDFFWLYDSKEYCVGVLINQKERFDIKYSKLSAIIDNVINVPEGKKIQGEKCYKYFIENHSNMKKIATDVLMQIKNSSLSFNKIQTCLKYIPYNLIEVSTFKIFNIFSVKRLRHLYGTRYRVFNIPFFRIKFFKNIKTYYFFTLPIFSNMKLNHHIVYWLCKIKIYEYRKKGGFTFPAAKFDDREKYNDKN
ncbi:glycosyltransferase [Campylobacter coli]|uniref:glycosyltransferase n=1 Tax=Campylobacter coli TaxID=195 RepID=UPI0024DDFD32|nr:glycosyltransferase [Campylobacter coli]MDK2048824.1 glycosyltransferase [Campylobacter coli]